MYLAGCCPEVIDLPFRSVSLHYEIKYLLKIFYIQFKETYLPRNQKIIFIHVQY